MTLDPYDTTPLEQSLVDRQWAAVDLGGVLKLDESEAKRRKELLYKAAQALDKKVSVRTSKPHEVAIGVLVDQDKNLLLPERPDPREVRAQLDAGEVPGTFGASLDGDPPPLDPAPGANAPRPESAAPEPAPAPEPAKEPTPAEDDLPRPPRVFAYGGDVPADGWRGGDVLEYDDGRVLRLTEDLSAWEELEPHAYHAAQGGACATCGLAIDHGVHADHDPVTTKTGHPFTQDPKLPRMVDPGGDDGLVTEDARAWLEAEVDRRALGQFPTDEDREFVAALVVELLGEFLDAAVRDLEAAEGAES